MRRKSIASGGPHRTRQLTMPGVDFETVRGEISMIQVLDQLGFEPASRMGDQWRGPCPVHGSSSSRSRSFSVNVTTGRYYCHKCHSRGNQLELWAAANNMTIYQAALDLCIGAISTHCRSCKPKPGNG